MNESKVIVKKRFSEHLLLIEFIDTEETGFFYSANCLNEVKELIDKERKDSAFWHDRAESVQSAYNLQTHNILNLQKENEELQLKLQQAVKPKKRTK